MKLRVNQPKKVERRGRKRRLGGKKINFYPGQDRLNRMAGLEVRRKKLKLPFKFTQSYLLREGADMICDLLESLMNKATSGDLHAKKRVSQFGLKPETV